MQVLLKQHIPLMCSFSADAGIFNVSKGGVLNTLQVFHPRPHQACTSLPYQQGGRVLTCCYAASLCRVRLLLEMTTLNVW